MCGFVGFSGYLENRAEVLERMMNRIIHRGPDMADMFMDQSVALGFRRLSIIDLSEAGRQPMQNRQGNVTVVFNGEIYNFEALRAELEKKGHHFSTRTDTETLIHGYEEWGEGMVDRLRGMYAFVIWDSVKRTLFGARDIFGIKPFYYTRVSDGILFGSEIKSFLEHPNFVKKVNRRALRPYLTFQYSAMDETFFEGVYKLPPAHCFTYCDGELNIRRYWDEDYTEGKWASFEACAEAVDHAVNESVAAHRIADVKVGTFLSGGVDSSYITASMMPDTTFSVGFDFNKFDETTYAAELSERLGIRNCSRMLSSDECLEALSTIQYHMDEPQSNPSSVPLYFLAKLASEQVTVVLSGEGADEMYAGYEWYADLPSMKNYKKLPLWLRRAAAKCAEHLPYFKGHDMIIRAGGHPEDYFIGQALVYTEKEAKRLLREPYRCGPTAREVARPIYERVKNCDDVTKKQYLDMQLWLPGDILLKADKMSMAHSLELRVPFLDRVVMTQAQSIPASYRIRGTETKAVLREAAGHTLPEDWARRPKKGFPTPIRYWLCEDRWYDYAKSHFSAAYADEFFDCSVLLKMLDEHRAGQANHARKLWTALVFLVWYERFFILETAGAGKGENEK